MSLVVEFKKGWRVWMLLLQMNVVNFRLFRGESTVLTDVNLTELCVSQRFPVKNYFTFDLRCLYSY